MKRLIQIKGLCLLWTMMCGGVWDGQSQTNPASAIFSQAPAKIGQYIVESFEDSKGNLWFGTLSKGVACFDGHSLHYFDTGDGLIGNAVVSIVEDKDGTLWFGTHSGLARFDGKHFTNYTRKDGLIHNRVSNLLIDRAGRLWIGTWGGVSRFDGKQFTDFPLPIPPVELKPYQTTMDWVSAIAEDPDGNIWFGRDGYGATYFDGKSFSHILKQDGLLSNNVQAILPDSKGNIWFGSRIAEKDHPEPEKRIGPGGLSRLGAGDHQQFPRIEGMSKRDIYALHEDRSGKIWTGVNGVGLYWFDGQTFGLYKKTDVGFQHILEDRQGRLWLGCAGGLFRLINGEIVEITQGGPWK